MKNNVTKTIHKFLPSLQLKVRGLVLKPLPTIYTKFYEFEELDIFDIPFLVIKVKDKTLGPKDFKKHSRVFKEKINYPQIWYLKELHAHKVRRMIENELNFVIEDKLVHLPSVNISIRHQDDKVKIVQSVTGLSVNILIREVLKGDLTGKSKGEIAEIFKTTNMTAGRAIESLLTNDLCEEEKVGASKRLYFKSRPELWSFIKEKISSPIKEIIFIDKLPKSKSLPLTGLSALARLTMISDEEIPTLASDKKTFFKKNTNTKPVLEDNAHAKIQLWNRSAILQDNECINVIDIFLTLKDVQDERVQIELVSLLKKYELEL